MGVNRVWVVMHSWAELRCSRTSEMRSRVVANAMCAKQSGGDYVLDCQAVNSDSSYMAPKDTGVGYGSKVQCPVDYVMFDCSAFVEGVIDECSATSNDDFLTGEFYYKEKKRSKSYCKALGDSEYVRAQAVCCGLF